MLCNCNSKVHSFKCFLRNIADTFVPGKDNH